VFANLSSDGTTFDLEHGRRVPHHVALVQQRDVQAAGLAQSVIAPRLVDVSEDRDCRTRSEHGGAQRVRPRVHPADGVIEDAEGRPVHQQHVELASAYPKIAVAYTQIVTISTDNILETREFRASVGAQWTFLSDAGRKLQKDLDIQEYSDPFHDPMVPHTLVLKPGLVIHSLYNGYWFWGRPSIDELWRDLREATREIRPDWDLSASGLREAWDAGDRSRFYRDEDLDPSLRAA